MPLNRAFALAIKTSPVVFISMSLITLLGKGRIVYRKMIFVSDRLPIP
jgi:hypothetical protein